MRRVSLGLLRRVFNFYFWISSWLNSPYKFVNHKKAKLITISGKVRPVGIFGKFCLTVFSSFGEHFLDCRVNNNVHRKCCNERLHIALIAAWYCLLFPSLFKNVQVVPKWRIIKRNKMLVPLLIMMWKHGLNSYWRYNKCRKVITDRQAPTGTYI